MSLQGKVAVITGASKGIGRAIAHRLAKDGAKVVVSYGTDAQGARSVVEEIGTENAVAIQGDVGKLSDIVALVEKTVALFGRIDILIPNAGVMYLVPLESLTEEIFDTTFSVNVKGPLFLCQKAAPYMPSGSHIVLISTSLCATSTITPVYISYVSSKGAIEQMTRVMAKDLGRKGICVNCVAPGPTATGLFLKNQNEQSLSVIKGMNPQGRIAECDEIADAVALLCGHGSRWIIGQTLRVNGGSS